MRSFGYQYVRSLVPLIAQDPFAGFRLLVAAAWDVGNTVQLPWRYGVNGLANTDLGEQIFTHLAASDLVVLNVRYVSTSWEMCIGFTSAGDGSYCSSCGTSAGRSQPAP